MPRQSENDDKQNCAETHLTIPINHPPEEAVDGIIDDLIGGLRETAARNEARADRATVRDILDITDELRRRKRGGCREQ